MSTLNALAPVEAVLPADELIGKLTVGDPAVRMAAAHAAGPAGASVLPALARLLLNPDRDIAKAAGEAVTRIVHEAARPGGTPKARSQVAAALVAWTDPGQPPALRRIAVRLLEAIGGPGEIAALSRLLSDPQLQEDVRLTLERIPGGASQRSLTRSIARASATFRPHLEQSVHHRGVAARKIGIRGG